LGQDPGSFGQLVKKYKAPLQHLRQRADFPNALLHGGFVCERGVAQDQRGVASDREQGQRAREAADWSDTK
jgi:hypothetical protein